MRKREKAIIGSTIIIFGTIFNLFFTAALHGLLSRAITRIALIPISECIMGLFTHRQQLLLFLAFEGFLVLLLVIFIVQNQRTYQSDLLRVTDDIYTPASVGQYQHGSSRWLKDSEKDKVFDNYLLDPNHKLIKRLLDTAYDFDFLKGGSDCQIPKQEAQDRALQPGAAPMQGPFDERLSDFEIDEVTGEGIEPGSNPAPKANQPQVSAPVIK